MVVKKWEKLEQIDLEKKKKTTCWNHIQFSEFKLLG